MNRYIICVLVLSSLMTCNAQHSNHQDFVKIIEQAVSNPGIDIAMLADKVYFEAKGKRVFAENARDKINVWNKVKTLFRGTDYIIKEDTLSTIKACEIKNHKHIFIIELNEKGKISVLREVELKLPPGAPRVNESRF